MTTLLNLTFKIETSWAKNVVKSILETWNANDLIVYVWFIYRIYYRNKKTKKTMQYKEE